MVARLFCYSCTVRNRITQYSTVGWGVDGRRSVDLEDRATQAGIDFVYLDAVHSVITLIE